MRQFNLIDIRPSADGKYVTAVICDKDWNTDTLYDALCDRPFQFIDETDYGPRVRFPKRMLVGSVLDLDRR
jgi:hypothetical protein